MSQARLTVQTGIPESDQESSFQNATLHSGPEGIAVSIALYGNYPDDVKTEADVKAYLESRLSLLVDAGFTVEVQIGIDCDTETALEAESDDEE